MTGTFSGSPSVFTAGEAPSRPSSMASPPFPQRDFCNARDLEAARMLNPDLQTLDDWLAKNKDRLPIA
ncbi:MAG: hypothetical protein AABO58_23025 [Acidobacteriota bacterium]